MSQEEANYLCTLKQRRDWLNARIEAKIKVGWDIIWDTRERDSLTWAIELIETRWAEQEL